MSLCNIRQSVVAKLKSTALNNPTEKSYIDSLINSAAKELHDTHELIGSMEERVVFFADIASKVVALPVEMGIVKGIRYSDRRARVEQNPLQSRYGYSNYLHRNVFNFRDKGFSPLKVEITNATRLLFTTELPEPAPVVFNIRGQTSSSASFTEKVTLAAGELSAESVGAYEKVFDLTKTAPSVYDTTIYDGAEQEVAKFANNKVTLLYKILQVLDDDLQTQPDPSAVEILFKIPFTPLVSDGDQFLGSDLYDDVVFWKVLENWFLLQKDMGGDGAPTKSAAAMRIKINDMIAKFFVQHQASLKKEVEEEENPYYGLIRGRNNWYRGGELTTV